MNESWNGERCPVCGEGTLHDGIREERSEYRGRAFHARQHGAFCDVCDEGILYADVATEQQWKEFKARVDKSEQSELADIRRRLGLTQRQASALTGGGHNAFSRYERGQAQPMLAVMNLFRILDRYPQLLAYFGFNQPAECGYRYSSMLQGAFHKQCSIGSEFNRGSATAIGAATIVGYPYSAATLDPNQLDYLEPGISFSVRDSCVGLAWQPAFQNGDDLSREPRVQSKVLVGLSGHGGETWCHTLTREDSDASA